MMETLRAMPTGVWVVAGVGFVLGLALELFFDWLRGRIK